MKKNLYSFVAVCFLLLCTIGIKAQSISYPAASENISVCFDSTKLTVAVTGASATVPITIDLPTGVSYIPSSFTFTAGSGTVVEAGTPNVPVFNLTGATSAFTFTIKRRADCSARAFALGGGNFKDEVTVGSVSEIDPATNAYVVKYPSLNITQPASLTNVALGSNQTRTFTFKNAGQGCADTVFLTIDYVSSGLVPNGNITVQSVSFAPDAALSTLTKKVYKIFGTASFIGGYCDGEPPLVVTQPVTVVSCTPATTNYEVGWGCNAAEICQSATTNGNITVLATIPNLSAAVTVVTAGNGSCAASPYGTFTATVTNTGNGPANNISFQIGNTYANNFTSNREEIIDTASVLVNGVHPSGIIVLPSWVITKENNVVPDCAVGKPGMCKIIMPTGFTVPANGTFTVTWKINICASDNCGDGHYPAEHHGLALNYASECGASTSGAYQGFRYGPTNYFSGSSVQLPAQVQAGSCFKYKVDFPAALGPVGVGNTQYVEVKVTLPAGFTIGNLATDVYESLTGNSPHPGFPKQVGQDVIIRYWPGSVNQVTFKICTPLTGACGVQNIPYELKMVNDSTCTSATQLVGRRCGAQNVEVICATPCPTGGIVPTVFNFYRTTYGLPDNDQDGKPDATGTVDLNKIDLDRYKPGDTLHTEYRSYVANQSSPSTITNWNFAIAEWKFNYGTWNAATAKVTIKRGATNYIATGVPITALVANKSFRANWAGATFTPALPASYIANDSVIVEADFRYLPLKLNNANPHNVVGETGGSSDADAPQIANLTHSVYAAQSVPATELVNLSNGFTCFIPKYNANVLGHWNFLLLDATSDPIIASGCNNVTMGFHSYTRVLGTYANGQYFLYEYRPMVKQDSVVLTIPSGYDYVSTSLSNLTYTTKNGSAAAVNVTIPVTVTGNNLTGLKIKYDFKAAFASGAIPFQTTEGGYFSVNQVLKPGCNAPATVQVTGIEYGHYDSYPDKNNPTTYTSTHDNNINYDGLNKPGVVITNNSGNVQASTFNNNYWDVQLTGANTYNAPNVWLSTEQLAGSGISVVRVESPIGTTIPVSNNYGAGKNLYQINAAGLTNPANNIVRVYFSKTGCNSDTLKVRSGWNCNAFPTSADNGCNSNDLKLVATSVISEIQLLKITEPAANTTFDICSPVNYKIRVRSTQTGDLDNPVVKVALPAGVVPVGNNFTYSYPGDNNPQVFTVTQAAGVYTLTLENHTLMPTSGLKGVATAANDDERTAFVAFQVQVTSCTFVNGKSPTFQIFGDKVCGGPAIGNTLTVKGNKLKAASQGVTPALLQTITASAPTVTCGTTATITVTLTSSDVATYTGDSATYTIPAPLRYKAGSFNVTGGTLTSSTLASNQIKVALPAQAGNTVTFKYDVEENPSNIGCTATNYEVSGEVYRSSGYNCPSTFGSCQIANIADADTALIQIVKPSLSTSVFSALNSASIVSYSVDIANSGSIAAPAGIYLVKIFCGANNTGQLLHSFYANAVPAGASITQTGTFPYNSALCPGTSATFIQIQDTIAAGSTACLCSSPAGTNSISILPLYLITLSAQAQKTNVKITWKINNEADVKMYEVEHSADNTSFKLLATVMPFNFSSYNTLDNAPVNGINYYRVKVIDINGKEKYSNIQRVNWSKTNDVSIYPTPAKDYVTLESAGLIVGKTATINVISMDGKVVIKQNIVSLKSIETINLGNLPSGTYQLLIMANDNFRSVKKLVVIQ